MEKLKMQTADMAKRNIEMLGQMFPNCLTEVINADGKLVRAIDFDKLRQELACEVVEGAEERYQFTWPDKRNAIRLANAPINKTLRPCREESVDFDNTENLYIEGDNLEVLKLLRENYLGKVKMIYIDPPYNTGNDFVYNDDFAQGKAEFEAQSGLFDEEGRRMADPMVQNTESNGRFHTDWLNMIYPRLKVAKDLLSDDGVIFISIGDEEVRNMKIICDEVFGEGNFAAQFLWTKTATPPALSHKCRKTIEYVLCYERVSSNRRFFGSLLDGGDAPLLNTGNPIKKLLFPKGSVRFKFVENGTITKGEYDKTTILDDVVIVNGVNQKPFRMAGTFKWGQPMLEQEIATGTYFIIKSEKMSIRFQRPFNEVSFKTPNNFLNLELSREVGIGTNESAVKELEELGMIGLFDFPKPTSLIKYLIDMPTHISKEGLILDFFSGSATTAHAVMQLNAEDGGNRKFIMVQLPEKTDEKSEAYKAGYKNICEIGKERIRRAGKKIKEEAGLQGQNLDTGFRVLKLDESNMADVYYTPAETPIQLTLDFDKLVDNIREGRTAEDLLFQVLPECNLPLSSKIEIREIHGKKVFVVNDGYLMACFDKDINEAVITAIAKEKPYYFVMCDRSIASDSVADNFDQIFNAYSKDTVRRIL